MLPQPGDRGLLLSRGSLLFDRHGRSRTGAQISQWLTHRESLKANLLDTRLSVGFNLLRTDRAHFCFEIFKRVAENSFAACDGNIVPRRDRKHAAAHCAEMRGAIGRPPAHNSRDERGQQIRVARQYPKAAALVLGPHRRDIAAVDEVLPRRCHSETKECRSLWCGRVRGFLLVARLVNRADHVERTFLPLVAFAGEDRLAAGNRVRHRDRAAGSTGESFSHGERLRQKALQTPRPLDHAAVLGAELLDAEEGNHILQFAVMLDVAALRPTMRIGVPSRSRIIVVRVGIQCCVPSGQKFWYSTS